MQLTKQVPIFCCRKTGRDELLSERVKPRFFENEKPGGGHGTGAGHRFFGAEKPGQRMHVPGAEHRFLVRLG